MDVQDISRLVDGIERRANAGQTSGEILTNLLECWNHGIQQPEFEGKYTVLAWKISSLIEKLK